MTESCGAVVPFGCECEPYGGKFYMFCKNKQDAFWSHDLCTAFGMSLVAIEDEAENSWLASTAVGYGLNQFWTGGTDVGTEGEWLWRDGTQFWAGRVDGAPVDGRYSNWGSKYPADDGSNPGWPTDCALMGTSDGTWADRRCDGHQAQTYYVCEGAALPSAD